MVWLGIGDYMGEKVWFLVWSFIFIFYDFPFFCIGFFLFNSGFSLSWRGGGKT